MLIGGTKKLKSFNQVALNINSEKLDRVESFQYLGVVSSSIHLLNSYVVKIVKYLIHLKAK